MNIFRHTASKCLRGPLQSEAAEEAGDTGRPRELSDEELVNAVVGGNERAFDQLVTRHRGKVYAMIYNMVKNDADAWDISQEVFVKVWKALPKFEAKSKFSTWLFRIVHNAVYDWGRKRKITGAGELDDNLLREEDIEPGALTAPMSSSRPDKALELEELRARLDKALEMLPPQHREIILLREVQGMDYKEIAEVLHCSAGTVMSRLFYARQNLQKLLSDELEA